MADEDGKLPVGERITVGLLHRVASELHALNVETGMTKTDLVNRALTLYSFVMKQLDKGNDLLIRDNETGETERITIV